MSIAPVSIVIVRGWADIFEEPKDAEEFIREKMKDGVNSDEIVYYSEAHETLLSALNIW